MVYGAISIKSETFYTHLGKVFQAIGNQQKATIGKLPMVTPVIVPWNRALTLVIIKHKELVDPYMAAFPHSKDLGQHNAE